MDVSIIGSGPQENIEQQVDPTFQAARVSLRPLEWNLPGQAGGGHYFFSAASGALAGSVSANSPLASIRWTDAVHYFVLKRAAIVYYITTAYATAQMNDFDLIRATGFTASDTGGAAVTPLKKRTANMGNSLVGDARVCTTAALTAGTRTVDGASVRTVADGPPNVAIPTATLAVARQELVLYDNRDFAVHPIVLGANEGLLIRNVTAIGASGVLKVYFSFEWAEVAQF